MHSPAHACPALHDEAFPGYLRSSGRRGRLLLRGGGPRHVSVLVSAARHVSVVGLRRKVRVGGGVQVSVARHVSIRLEVRVGAGVQLSACILEVAAAVVVVQVQHQIGAGGVAALGFPRQGRVIDDVILRPPACQGPSSQTACRVKKSLGFLKTCRAGNTSLLLLPFPPANGSSMSLRT